MTDRELFEKWWKETKGTDIPYTGLASFTEDVMFSAWQARGELDAVRIKELEEKLKDAEDAAWNNYKAVETITDYLIENDWLEITVEGDGKEAALNIINSIQKQIAELTVKLDKAREALKCIDEDLVNPVHYILVKESLQELDK